ncbi:MAG: hypothetical protein RIE56_12875 [Amphiplicatus sp.]
MTDIEQKMAGYGFSQPNHTAETSAMASQTAGYTAGYIEELTAELEKLAEGPDLERLRDLLRLAKSEARRVLIKHAR